jgi:hypothetical protein
MRSLRVAFLNVKIPLVTLATGTHEVGDAAWKHNWIDGRF